MRKYIWNLVLALDRLGNAILGGDSRETISSRAAKHRKTSTIAKELCEILDNIDENHCEDSIENLENR